MIFKKILFLLLLIATLVVFGCNDDDDNNTNTPVDFEDLQVDSDFNYETSRTVTLNVHVLNGQDEGISLIPFKVYDKDPSEGGRLLDSGVTNEDGQFSSITEIPTYITNVFLVGYMSSMELPITNNVVTYSFGESDNKERRNTKIMDQPKSELVYLNDFNEYGIPFDMESDVIDPDFLTKVNATFPERLPVPQYHPDYLLDGNQKNVLLVNDAADVWVTFVHEGAGFKNALGFYTYQEDDIPNTTDDIDTIKVIFPNVSMSGSGGGLIPGDKVYLGQFEPGTIIAWVLLTNGWYSNQANITERTWYSDPHLNYTQLQQSILVFDAEYEKMLFGFEDLVFEQGDDDFNDAIFYATANPIESVSTIDVPSIDSPGDKDNDGISDVFDDFPNDPDRAFETNDGVYSTLAFEDLWPTKGDYDFNDLVIDYNFFFHKATSGRVKNMICEFELKAVGARKQNGFAVQFPFSSSNIEYINIIDGADTLTYSNIVSDANFNPVLEAGSNAVINFINNTNDLIQAEGNGFINTQADVPYITPVKFAVDIKFASTENMSNWEWNVPFNPFIFVDRNRTHEIHLPNYPPTNLANLDLFGMDHDDSNLSQSRYYKTINNHPWAINIAESWDHPYETEPINKAYLKFQPWAESSGSGYTDWYLNNTGYRNEDKIYQINAK